MFVGGPVMLSIALFSMKLVLHDTDSLCTFVMHYYPLLVMFRYRHYQYDSESKFLTSYQIDDWLHNFSMYDLVFYYVISLLAYSGWSFSYYWVVFVKLDDYLKIGYKAAQAQTTINRININFNTSSNFNFFIGFFF